MRLEDFPYKMDKAAFSVVSLYDESDEKQYWLSKTPHERLRAVEFLRQIAYAYDPSSERLQRVLEVSKLNKKLITCLSADMRWRIKAIPGQPVI
jgi:hypothetical protein